MQPSPIDPRTLDMIVRAVVTTLTAQGLVTLCDPRCRAAVRGLLARVNDISEIAERLEDQAALVSARLIPRSDPAARRHPPPGR
jgi:DNA-binding GntR family transcriptional regulator